MKTPLVIVLLLTLLGCSNGDRNFNNPTCVISCTNNENSPPVPRPKPKRQ
jgi:hypothetical protein